MNGHNYESSIRALNMARRWAGPWKAIFTPTLGVWITDAPPPRALAPATDDGEVLDGLVFDMPQARGPFAPYDPRNVAQLANYTWARELLRLALLDESPGLDVTVREATDGSITIAAVWTGSGDQAAAWISPPLNWSASMLLAPIEQTVVLTPDQPHEFIVQPGQTGLRFSLTADDYQQLDLERSLALVCLLSSPEMPTVALTVRDVRRELAKGPVFRGDVRASVEEEVLPRLRVRAAVVGLASEPLIPYIPVRCEGLAETHIGRQTANPVAVDVTPDDVGMALNAIRESLRDGLNQAVQALIREGVRTPESGEPRARTHHLVGPTNLFAASNISQEIARQQAADEGRLSLPPSMQTLGRVPSVWRTHAAWRWAPPIMVTLSATDTVVFDAAEWMLLPGQPSGQRALELLGWWADACRTVAAILDISIEATGCGLTYAVPDSAGVPALAYRLISEGMPPSTPRVWLLISPFDWKADVQGTLRPAPTWDASLTVETAMRLVTAAMGALAELAGLDPLGTIVAHGHLLVDAANALLAVGDRPLRVHRPHAPVIVRRPPGAPSPPATEALPSKPAPSKPAPKPAPKAAPDSTPLPPAPAIPPQKESGRARDPRLPAPGSIIARPYAPADRPATTVYLLTTTTNAVYVQERMNFSDLMIFVPELDLRRAIKESLESQDDTPVVKLLSTKGDLLLAPEERNPEAPVEWVARLDSGLDVTIWHRYSTVSAAAKAVTATSAVNGYAWFNLTS